MVRAYPDPVAVGIYQNIQETYSKDTQVCYHGAWSKEPGTPPGSTSRAGVDREHRPAWESSSTAANDRQKHRTIPGPAEGGE